jgi:isocitrate/isopropylmalate dehydrogenase
MPKNYEVVVLPGDGVGREVIPEAVKALNAAQESISGLKLSFEEYGCGFEYYKQNGEPWSEDAYTACRESDAILFGAVGLPGVEGLEHIVYMHRHLRHRFRKGKYRGSIRAYKRVPDQGRCGGGGH